MTITRENLGPAERIINTLLAFTDHMVHNRPGIVTPNAHSVVGSTWAFGLWKKEGEQRIAYRKDQVGKRTNLVRIGVLRDDNTIEGTNSVYRPAGLYPEVAVWMYKQIAEVWKLDNEFAAKWASYAYKNDTSKDRRVLLAAFMLVQSRKGDAVRDNGTVAFHDEDYRNVGEAMMLLSGSNYLDLKLILRIGEVLTLPEIAQINRELGFGQSTRNPYYGRYNKVAQSWLRYREENPKLLEGLIKGGSTQSLQWLARNVQYKPQTSKFFQTLRWRQSQSKTGHRTLAIGDAVKAAESWDGLREEQICEKIVTTRPNFKRIVGLLPASVGMTRAIMAASIEAGALSDKDIVIQVPTIEELGLLSHPGVKARIETALKAAEDQRAANVAKRVKSKDLQVALQESSENAVKKEVAKVLKDLRVFVLTDISGSMQYAIEIAKQIVSKSVAAFPLEKVHAGTFNTVGRVLNIKHASVAGVGNAFQGVNAGGGTSHASGVLAFKDTKLKENEEALMIFVGDEEEHGTFELAFNQLSWRPSAFGFVKVVQNAHTAVRSTAAALKIPCFMLDAKVFDDTYALPNTLRTLIESTPVATATSSVVRAQPRFTLVDTILSTELLKKPLWAA